MTTYLTWLGNNVMLGNFDVPKPQLVGTGGPSAFLRTVQGGLGDPLKRSVPSCSHLRVVQGRLQGGICLARRHAADHGVHKRRHHPNHTALEGPHERGVPRRLPARRCSWPREGI